MIVSRTTVPQVRSETPEGCSLCGCVHIPLLLLMLSCCTQALPLYRTRCLIDCFDSETKGQSLQRVSKGGSKPYKRNQPEEIWIIRLQRIIYTRLRNKDTLHKSIKV